MTPRRRHPPLSQHFLHDRRIAAHIADLVRAPPGARVLEIGPGEGALTEHLIERGWRVMAVELDHGLFQRLAERWRDRPDVEIAHGDALVLTLPKGSGPWWVVGNLPYAITSPLVFHLLDQVGRGPIAEMVFMVQKEVAARLTARPGTKTYGALTVGVTLVADVETVLEVGPGSFRPPPRVRSAVVRLTPHRRWPLSARRRARLRAMVQALFGQRRKQLQKSLRTLEPWKLGPRTVQEVMTRAAIDPSRRPETLAVEDWIRLDAALARVKG
ncbi:MAG: 16S rRNA (adenine(1518)-N(6)/adenine(1519)-N(6))-dimethyltransferase RsmA [Gemmatimonadota bacterium]